MKNMNEVVRFRVDPHEQLRVRLFDLICEINDPELPPGRRALVQIEITKVRRELQGLV